jgi:hypothetical protein
MISELPDSLGNLCQMIRHELGHAYANQVSLKLGLGRWPPIPEKEPDLFDKGSDVWFGDLILDEALPGCWNMAISHTLIVILTVMSLKKASICRKANMIRPGYREN